MIRSERTSRSNGNILFVSPTSGWAACEELWSQAAEDLVRQGFDISACVTKSVPLHPRLERLKSVGIGLHFLRPERYSIWDRGSHFLLHRGQSKWKVWFERCLRQTSPGLVVFSDGFTYPDIELLDLCIKRAIPFLTVSHKNWGELWMADDVAQRYHDALSRAERCYFVSEGNLRLAQKQLGHELANAEVVRNPFNVGYSASPTWPPLDEKNGLRMACVGRLDPGQKGQDILFEALSGAAWAERDWHLTLYGDGPVRMPLVKLASRLGISEHVTFAGHVNSVEEIWASNHVLVMPSHHEGLPLAMVEAMLCSRPVLATDVAGHAEVIRDGDTGFLAESPTVGSVSRSMERLWERRADLEAMGQAGAKLIRKLVPENPARVFSEQLKTFLR